MVCPRCGLPLAEPDDDCPQCVALDEQGEDADAPPPARPDDGARMPGMLSLGVGIAILLLAGLGILLLVRQLFAPAAPSGPPASPSGVAGDAAQAAGLTVTAHRLIRQSDGTRAIAGTLHNTSGTTYRYAHVAFDLFDLTDAKVGTAIATTAALAPDARWRFSAPVTAPDAVTYRLAGVTGF